MDILTEWEYDPEYWFDYDTLDKEEQYTFQAMECGACLNLMKMNL